MLVWREEHVARNVGTTTCLALFDPEDDKEATEELLELYRAAVNAIS